MLKQPPKEIMEAMERNFRYDRVSGILFRIYSDREEKAGTYSFQKNKKTRYISVCFNNRLYRSHHIIWLLCYGYWPTMQIDHIDGDGTNNRIENLRDVDLLINLHNRSKQINNTSGHNGVYKRPNGKWCSKIGVCGGLIHLGTFKSKQEALKARKQANKKYGFSDSHGIRTYRGTGA